MFFIYDLFYYHLKHTWMHAWGSQIYIYILFTVGSRLLFFFKKKEKQIQELKMRWKRGPTKCYIVNTHSTLYTIGQQQQQQFHSFIHLINRLVWSDWNPKIRINSKQKLSSLSPLFSPLFFSRSLLQTWKNK